MNYKTFVKSKHKDKIKGGKADAKKPSDFDKKQLEAGTKVEMEHTNDKTKAQEIAMDHLTEDADYYKKLKQVHLDKAYPGTSDCGTGLSGKICTHNKKKLNKTSKEEFIQKFKKSYDWKDVQVTVDANDHKVAEQTTPQELIQYLKSQAAQSDISKINFAKGTLTLSKTAAGLYSGFFQGQDGQIIDKYEPTTLEIVAKNLMVKNLYDGLPQTVDVSTPVATIAPASEPAVAVDAPKEMEKHDDVKEDEALIAERVSQALAMHNEVYHRGQEPFEPISNGKGSLKMRYGNFELEIKKSVQEFVKSVKSQKTEQKDEMKKAISSWRRNSAKQFGSDLEAAQALAKNWDTHCESFNQTLFAIQQLKKKRDE